MQVGHGCRIMLLQHVQRLQAEHVNHLHRVCMVTDTPHVQTYLCAGKELSMVVCNCNKDKQAVPYEMFTAERPDFSAKERAS